MEKEPAIRKTKHWLIKLLIVLVVIIPLVAVALQYYRVQGFKNTLISLVDNQTQGKYVLSIGSTDIQFLKLSFTLKDLAIVKVDLTDSSGVRSVTTQRLTVTMGSLLSIVSGNQFNIKEFSITEPVAIIGLGEKDQDLEKVTKEPVNLAHEIAIFYPAVQSLLDQFDIKLFHIDRASMELDRSDLNINVGLIDLLVSDWNMRNLTDDARFRLSLGEQTIGFATTEFSFESIVYDYQLNELGLTNYTFVQRDSLDREVIEIKGELLLVSNLDYQTLVEDESYILEALIVERPLITAHVYPHEKKDDQPEYPISTLLKRNLREMRIIDCKLMEARMELNIYGESDTLTVNLPHLTLETQNITVTEDSSTLMIDELYLELSKTRLDMGGPLSLKFSKLTYDEDFNLEIDSIELLDNINNTELITCEYLKLVNFNFFHYYFENDLVADSLVLKNGQVNTIKDAPGLKQSNQPQKTAKRNEPPTLHIANARLEDVDLNLDLGDHMIAARKMTTILENFRIEDRTTYHLRYLGGPEFIYENPLKAVKVQIDDIFFDRNRLQLMNMQGAFDDLSIVAGNFNATLTQDFSLEGPWYHQLYGITLDELNIRGALPVAKDTTKNASIPDLRFDHVSLDNFQLDLQLPNQDRFYVAGKDFKLNHPRMEDNRLAVANTQMQLNQAWYRSDSNRYAIREAMVNSDSISLLKDIMVSIAGKDSLRARQVIIGPWQKELKEVNLAQLQISQVDFQQYGREKRSTADRIVFTDVTMKEAEQPHINRIDIFGPDIYLFSGQSKKTGAAQGINIAPFKLFEELYVEPGQVTINDQALSFNGIEIYGRDLEKDIEIKELAYKSPKISFHMHHLWTTVTDINIDSVTFVPNQDYVDRIRTETDIVAGQIYNLQFRDVDWQQLRDSTKIVSKDLKLNGFDISIRRDKSLPDPEPFYKPYLLSTLFPSSQKLVIPRIITQNGNITYHQVGAETGQEGKLKVSDINVTLNHAQPIWKPEDVLSGTARLYGKGRVSFDYRRLDSCKFSLRIRLEDFPVTSMNELLEPIQAIGIESGHISEFEFQVEADSLIATGEALMSYEDLRIRLYKKDSPGEFSLGADLLTIIVDGLIIRRNLEGARAEFTKERVTHKGPFNYWVKAAIQAAVAAILKGKPAKKKRKGKRQRDHPI